MESKSNIIHYGKVLKQSVFTKGVTHKSVMSLLGIKSHKTLCSRFLDGAFTYDQLIKLEKEGLLNAE